MGRYLFCAWPCHPSKAVANAVHMSIYTNPLNIVPSNIHYLKSHTQKYFNKLSQHPYYKDYLIKAIPNEPSLVQSLEGTVSPPKS